MRALIRRSARHARGLSDAAVRSMHVLRRHASVAERSRPSRVHLIDLGGRFARLRADRLRVQVVIATLRRVRVMVS